MITPVVGERIDTIVIGGGQARLAVGYYLARHGVPFIILDAHQRIGNAWRQRWDSLRLFTPALVNGLPGLRFPGRWDSFPTKDHMADYLERYAQHFALPVRSGVLVERLGRHGERYQLIAGDHVFEAEHVVVAMASYQKPRVPSFAHQLSADICQLHSAAYRNPSQLRAGDVLVVGAGNSGAEIAVDVARRHRTFLSGRDVGQMPFRVESAFARYFLMHVFLKPMSHYVLTTSTPLGRKARPIFLTRGGPLVRTRRSNLAAAGVQRVPRTIGVGDGRPLLEDGRVMDATNVIWCTGFVSDFSWIDLPIHGELEPKHERGIVPGEPGLYFVGLKFLYAASSSMVLGVSRDAKRVADTIVFRLRHPVHVSEIKLRSG
jgi:putative flavoprotein involved in K+ transport